MREPPYVELRAASAFSFLRSTIPPAELARQAAALGHGALALGDRDGLQGSPQFWAAAEEVGLRPIVGCDLAVEGLGRLLLLARDVDGYRHLCRLATLAHARAEPEARGRAEEPDRGLGGTGGVPPSRPEGGKPPGGPQAEGRGPHGPPDPTVSWEELEAHAGGLTALCGGPEGILTRALSGGGALALADRLEAIFGRAHIVGEVQRHGDPRQERLDRRMLALAVRRGLRVVATNGVRCLTPADRPLLDVLTCIREKTTLESAGTLLARNAEAHLKSPAAMAERFADLPRVLAATREVARECAFAPGQLPYRFPDFPVPPGETEVGLLRAWVEEGARRLYRPMTAPVRAQLDRELSLIEKLGLAGYFLIVADLIRFCERQGILAKGRGSAANSAVCYALNITTVDPVGRGLLFERFLSEERARGRADEPDRGRGGAGGIGGPQAAGRGPHGPPDPTGWPDIDVDLPSGDEREKVIQYVFSTYGARRAAMCAEVITYRDRSAVREVGKVLGFGPGEIERLSRGWAWFESHRRGEDGSAGRGARPPPNVLGGWAEADRPKHLAEETREGPGARRLRDAGLAPEDPRVKLWVALCARIQDLPRHLSQHSGGMIIAAGHLDEVVPIQPARMPNRTIIQWDKDDAEALGLIKIDLLGLGMLAALQEAQLLVREQEDPAFDIAHLPPEDPAVYALCNQPFPDTIGVFQIESRAQIATLPRQKPREFYDLVVEVGLIRPGPLVGKMVNPYLKRRAGREPVTYLHPSLEPILGRTLGFPLFQEQLLRVAMTLAGFGAGEAEALRRAMTHKRSADRMAAFAEAFQAGARRKGLSAEQAREAWSWFDGFAQYGFPESHAYAFAYWVYASAYLKAHHPAAFLAALLNAQPMGFYSAATLVKDAQRHGVAVRPPDVLRSRWSAILEGEGVRLGLRTIQGLGHRAGARFEAERRRGPFASPGDLAERCGLGLRQMEAIAEAGALAGFGLTRRQALWEVRAALGSGGPLWAGRLPLAEEDRPNPPPLAEEDRPNPPPLAGEGRVGVEPELPASNPLPAPAPPGMTSFRAERGISFGKLADDSRLSHVGTGPPSPLPEMSSLEETLADYHTLGATTGPQIVAHHRAELARAGVTPAAAVLDLPNGRWTRIGGLVIARQHPTTVQGLIFVTVEDETGHANAVVLPEVFERYRAALLDAPLLVIEGPLQNVDGVATVQARKLQPFGARLPRLASHDFR